MLDVRQRRYLQIVRRKPSQDGGDETILLATLDRIAIGPILRSNLVFLINVSCIAMSQDQATQNHSAENVWTLIMRAIKCLKGVRRMPWR